MKRSLSVFLVVSMLALMLAGTAMAANVSATSVGNSSTITIGTTPVTVYASPQAPTLTAAQVSVLPVFSKNATIAYATGANAFVPDATNYPTTLSTAELIAINNTYGSFIVHGPVSTAAAASVTSAIRNNTTWTGKFNTAGFQNLFTPAVRAMDANTNGGFVVTAYPFPGQVMNSLNVGQLAISKFVPSIAGAPGRVEAYTKRVTAASLTGTTDGELWFTTDATGTSVMASSATFASGTTYYMWTLLKDDGRFDLSSGATETAGFVLDPPTVSPAVAADDGDDSSGCVYNPAAGLSLEWLLLIAPALGALVARIRRK